MLEKCHQYIQPTQCILLDSFRKTVVLYQRTLLVENHPPRPLTLHPDSPPCALEEYLTFFECFDSVQLANSFRCFYYDHQTL